MAPARPARNEHWSTEPGQFRNRSNGPKTGAFGPRRVSQRGRLISGGSESEGVMQADYRNRSGVRVPLTTTPRWPIKRIMAESWLIGGALVFLGLDLIGLDDPDAALLIVLVSALLSADILAGAVCLLKGYAGVGWLALTAWMVLPISVAVSRLVFEERWASEFFGSVVGAVVVLVVAAPALATARQRARYGSYWERRGWTN